MIHSRRSFLQSTVAATAAATFPTSLFADQHGKDKLFDISLAQWSLNSMLFKGKLDPLDFPVYSKSQFGITAVEYVNQFFMDRAEDKTWLGELKKRCDDNGVKSLLIMCDRVGQLGDPDENKRQQSVEGHKKWVEAAKFLDCHSIRVNASSGGSFEEQQDRAADGLRKLSEFAAPHGLNVIVENHGGLSSNGAWLAGTIKKVALDNCGTLPDFGNFHIGNGENYDRYKGVAELMPFAKGVSAKSHDFDDQGNEIHTDYEKMVKIVLDAGYHGYIGIEYEGGKIPAPEGVKATKALLERVREKLTA